MVTVPFWRGWSGSIRILENTGIDKPATPDRGLTTDPSRRWQRQAFRRVWRGQGQNWGRECGRGLRSPVLETGPHVLGRGPKADVHRQGVNKSRGIDGRE